MEAHGKQAHDDDRSRANNTRPYVVEIIMRGAFTDLDRLEDIEIPESVVEIKDHAFRNNAYLKNVGIYAPLKHLPKSAFDNCRGIETLYLATGIKKISATFDDCNIKRISVPFGKVGYYKRRFPESLHKFIAERFCIEKAPYDCVEVSIVIGPITEEKRKMLIHEREACRRRSVQFDVEVVTPEEYKEHYGELPPEY